MKDLIEYIVKEITGSKEFTIEEEVSGNVTDYKIKIKPEYIGLVIGKNGKTIRAIRNLAKVRATLEKTPIRVFVSET